MERRHNPKEFVWAFLMSFMGRLGLVFFPVPVGVFRRQLVGYFGRDGLLEFYSHPNLVCTSHLIWVGWVVALGLKYNDFAATRGLWQITPILLGWLWIFVLLLTIIAMGVRFNRVACGFVAAFAVILVLAIAVMEIGTHLPITAYIRDMMADVPVRLDWGIPAVVSLTLGMLFAGVASWQRLNDRWILQRFGNYIEHANFQDKDRNISKGAKTFVASFDCLLRRYLLFGYGDIEVRSSVGNKLVDEIRGVFFASHHAAIMMRRLSATDARFEAVEDEEIEEEFSGEEN